MSMNRTQLRTPLICSLAVCTLLFFAQMAVAHPMGNFSVSHFASIRIERGYVEVRYLIDMAEIPTYQEIQRTGIVAEDGNPSLASYIAEQGSSLRGGLLLEIDGQPLELRLMDQDVLFTPGAGGLPTMKLGFLYRAAIENLSSSQVHQVHYLDKNFAGRSGWKEVIVTDGDGVSLVSSSVPATDRSAQLSNYPTDLLNSPPQDVEAVASFSTSLLAVAKNPHSDVAPPSLRPRVNSDTNAASATHSTFVLPARPAQSRAEANDTFAPAGLQPGRPSGVIGRASTSDSPLQLQANEQKTPRSKFTELISASNMGFWFLFPAALIAAGLGALHALEPGHGKTIVGAYLVGSRGTPRHAVLLGLIVTAAHTAGVYLLGVITLYASRWIVPEQLYPWLGIISGLTIAGLAAYLLLRAWTGEGADHGDEPGRSHNHWFASLAKPRVAEAVPATVPANQVPSGGHRRPNVSLRQLLVLGITGGIVPCPAALVVLLSALSLHRVGLGLFLIVAFSLGLAAVLIVIGLLMVSARQFMARWKGDGLIARRWLPVASSGFMLILGLGIAGRALLSTGIGAGFTLRGHLVSFLGIVLLGFFLGMRHSTDPDHVVAVSTIVSRERSVRHAALIGVLWGVGHTLTISLVGSAIILFRVVIPPRIGLSMEFSVAIMLILLGILNLTGILRWLTERFTPLGQSAHKLSPPLGEIKIPRSSMDGVISRVGLYQLIRPLVVGLVHGLAGSAAVALLVLSTIHSPLRAIAYLVIFGVGTIAGMMLMTSMIALPIAYTSNRFARAGSYLGVASGIVSTAFGMFLVYQIGLVDGLFTAQAHWIPR
jgi:ABC-type nickel/cobalt efflux system permease component RcnA